MWMLAVSSRDDSAKNNIDNKNIILNSKKYQNGKLVKKQQSMHDIVDNAIHYSTVNHQL
jgi:hypothetical protein